MVKNAEKYSELALSCSLLCPEAYELAGDIKNFYKRY